MDKINLSFLGTSLGYSISLFFIPLTILKATNSALLVSITYALDVIPYILFTPIIGWIGDKFNKKIVIIIGEAICLISSIILFFTPLTKEYAYLIISIGFIISTSSSLHHSIFQSIIPSLYATDTLPKANANIATISSITGIISPIIISSAFSFSYLNENGIILIMIFCYILSITSFLYIKYYHKKPEENENLFKGLITSWRFLNNNNELKNYSYLFFFSNFGLKMVFVSLIWIYSNVFQMENNQIAFNFIIIGVFSILGAKIAGLYIVPKFVARNVIITSLFLISMITLLLSLFKNSIYLTLLWGVVSLLSMIIVVSYFTFRQKNTPPELLGRIVSITRLISYLAIPPSAIISGYVVQHYNNEKIIYIISGSIMLLSCVFFYHRLKVKT
ncbi:MFS transporter [Histophilus somni]|uniref:MFS transporter n=1 Tax=Histophilus somni TaxID=731 RepID=A0AAX2S603_HISSO|nr:MFS transporter [Histophilus somni]TDF40999.1 MFS transporter [Histophilus somni]TEW31563.1 MFS transporter [Histophilus somni]TFF02863.1 MFS transporter [Histophilus somni]THA22080.1 MFS transporter [Histophilus somni]THA97612.1 MFS transporter [Histophilus somni]